jgi:hypothetical protein
MSNRLFPEITKPEIIMNTGDFTTTFTVEQTPEEAFAAVNDVRGWWSGEIEGDTAELGDEFTYRYGDLHRSHQKVTASIPAKRVVWHVSDAYLSFTQSTTEWNGTDIVFDITRNGDKTEVRFTHVGLLPQDECFASCSNAWGFYINDSLQNLITAGYGQPNPKE